MQEVEARVVDALKLLETLDEVALLNELAVALEVAEVEEEALEVEVVVVVVSGTAVEVVELEELFELMRK